MEELSYIKPAEQVKYPRNKRIPKRFSFKVDERTDDAIQVFLRIKPDRDELKDDFLSFGEEEDPNALVLKKKSTISKFKFTYIFEPNASQEEVFVKSAESNVQEFLNGKSAFIFTYGISSSGKTFTIQGNKKDPGLVPRTIASIFSSLEGSIDHSFSYCPERSVSIVELTESELSEKCLMKENVLNLARRVLQMLKKNNDIISVEELETLKNTTKKLEVYGQDDSIFSIWFSFAEIYNERIYDLMDDLKDVKTPLPLSVDVDKSAFVKGLRHIPVSSLEEAYLLYNYGLYNRTVNSTFLNERSSRSHAIFTIKLLGRPRTSRDSFFVSSSFSVCDLAGTERSKKTRNIGMKMEETKSINTSFLVLNRCLKIIRENQIKDSKQVVPFRESKLTQLMGDSLTSGSANLIMIVTVAQSHSLIDETEASLKFSAIATEIKTIIQPPVKQKRKMRFSTALSHINPGQAINWSEVASYKRPGFSSVSTRKEAAQLLNELEIEKNRRLEAEKKLAEMELINKEQSDSLAVSDRDFKASNELNQESLNLRIEKEELYEKYMVSRAENLKLKKKLRIQNEEFEAKYKSLESTNEQLEGMLDDAKEEVDVLQEDLKGVNELLTQKEEALYLKDEKISMLEYEIEQLEENLEHDSHEREVYDKLVTELESELREKKSELSDLQNKFVALERELKETKRELDDLKNKAMDTPSRNDYLIPRTPDGRSRSEERHRGLSDSDDPSFLLPIGRSRTTIKKKKKRTVKETTYYFDGPSNSSSASNTGKPVQRRLYKKDSEEDLSEPSDTLSVTCNTTQPSPNTLIRTLRTGKRY